MLSILFGSMSVTFHFAFPSQLPLQHWSSRCLKKGRCTILLQRSNRLRFGWGFQDFKHQLTFRWGSFNIHSPLHVFGKSDNHLPKYQTAQTSWQEVYKSLDSLGVGLWNPREFTISSVWHHTILNQQENCAGLPGFNSPGDEWESSQDIPSTKWDCHRVIRPTLVRITLNRIQDSWFVVLARPSLGHSHPS